MVVDPAVMRDAMALCQQWWMWWVRAILGVTSSGAGRGGGAGWYIRMMRAHSASAGAGSGVSNSEVVMPQCREWSSFRWRRSMLERSAA